jgi:hypothetical protein
MTVVEPLTRGAGTRLSGCSLSSDPDLIYESPQASQRQDGADGGP